MCRGGSMLGILLVIAFFAYIGIDSYVSKYWLNREWMKDERSKK